MTLKKWCSKTSDQLSILELSDIHLGHRKTTAEFLVGNLFKLIPDNDKTGELDMIILAGDVFDRGLPLYHEDIQFIRLFVSYLLKLCKNHDIVLRIVEGTPSHDWKQSKIFIEHNEMYGIGCDVKYHHTLSIEYIERFDTHILYVPDEWRSSNDDTWLEVVELLAANNLEKVDFAVMHGCFPHQIQKHLHDKIEIHNPDNYLSIVRHIIFVGHIHHYSVHERILSAGSTDRIGHGEEEPKGAIRVDMQGSSKPLITFVENTGAKQYVTLDFTDVKMEKVYRKLDNLIPSYPEDSHFRIICNKDDPANHSLKELKVEYHQHNWTVKTNEDMSDTIQVVSIDRSSIPRVVLNRDNLLDLLSKRLAISHPQYQQSGINLLTEIIDHVT